MILVLIVAEQTQRLRLRVYNLEGINERALRAHPWKRYVSGNPLQDSLAEDHTFVDGPRATHECLEKIDRNEPFCVGCVLILVLADFGVETPADSQIAAASERMSPGLDAWNTPAKPTG